MGNRSRNRRSKNGSPGFVTPSIALNSRITPLISSLVSIPDIVLNLGCVIVCDCVSIVRDQGASQEACGNTGDFDDDEGGGMTLNARARTMLMQKLDRTGTASSIAGSLGTHVINYSLLAPTSVVPILGALSSLVSPYTQATVAGPGGLLVSGHSVLAVSVPSVDTIGVPSECLLLKNMFDPNLE
ncbi:hypothetical protein Droror1_Dr00026488, partial [Drosera rotundifolia]